MSEALLGIGSLVSAGLGYLGTMQTNAANARQAELNRQFQAQQAQWANAANWNNMGYSMDFQREVMRHDDEINASRLATTMGFERDMANTAYQRATADMKAAGINPMLAFMKGGADTPNVSAPSAHNAGIAPATAHGGSGSLAAPMQNKLGALASGALQAAQVIQGVDQVAENVRKTRAETGFVADNAALVRAEADSTRANTGLRQAQTLVEMARLPNIDADTREKLGRLAVQSAEIGHLGASAASAQAQAAHTRQDMELIREQGRNSVPGVIAQQASRAGSAVGSILGSVVEGAGRAAASSVPVYRGLYGVYQQLMERLR